MAPSDAWLTRQNAALKLRAHGVTLDVSQGRVRLRATMPPQPGAPPKQQRISTGLSYPAQATEALQMAELLGSALERHRLGIEPFDWTPWLPKMRGCPKGTAREAPQVEGITGLEAIRTTRQWWEQPAALPGRQHRLRPPGRLHPLCRGPAAAAWGGCGD